MWCTYYILLEYDGMHRKHTPTMGSCSGSNIMKDNQQLKKNLHRMSNFLTLRKYRKSVCVEHDISSE